MEYINVEEFDVNSPEKAPLKDFFILTGGFLSVIFIIFLISGFFIDSMVSSLPQNVSLKIENKIADVVGCKNLSKDSYKDEKLQNTLDFLVQGEKNLLKEDLKIFVVHKKEVNAFAVPGGKIFITDALLKEVNDEKERNFVIAHELGHFANKDHLKLMGRQLVLITLSTVFLGENSSTTNFLINSAAKI